jgi:hypothetical protein
MKFSHYRFQLGVVHKLRNALEGRGGQRFVTKPFICTYFCYKGEGGLKIRKIALRNLWTPPKKI